MCIQLIVKQYIKPHNQLKVIADYCTKIGVLETLNVLEINFDLIQISVQALTNYNFNGDFI